MAAPTLVEHPLYRQRTFPARGVQSLCWHGERLVDWVGGSRSWDLDGVEQRARVSWGYRFDCAVSAPDGRLAVIYESLGTKGLIVTSGGKPIREINRSFYHADDYEYPVCLWNGPGGRLLLAHCPDEYNRLEIEDAESGERLTASDTRKPADFFHSRLSVNARCDVLMSAGWVWHPVDVVAFYAITAALKDPNALDSTMRSVEAGREVSSASWQNDERVLLGGSADEHTEEIVATWAGGEMPVGGIAVAEVGARRLLSTAKMSDAPGPMMPVGEGHAVAFFKRPRLVSLASGEVVVEWDDVPGWPVASSIRGHSKVMAPSIACDAKRGRFAVADSERITVVELSERGRDIAPGVGS